ncbi:bifunctional glutamate N-acetyltransferase/amino-acid acetyltransferase ArgJ [Sneathiella chungangensis]|uniref:Arginine biosynthesis bifunctional protein ArgJ n=1 Tax=Sneathiella chungangensis TaxID=1418234 RepID=A0A845MIV8_9PROT|nr:bifunctional glutamate N-acetyltransferase/amino-acid acetyltransferase ArgJ [Sneathiella chungangensis]MZR23266.1 bifunctional glutamate N-acetyltransferase/amino-acid acetyltransferase ArgJ [Sneathiella chungangensis]
MPLKKSPLAPAAFPSFPEIAGVRFACGNSGMRYKSRDDVMLAEFAPGTTVAGVFTKNSMPGAPVDWDRKILSNGTARGLVVNAGIANVFTGTAGVRTVEETAAAAARLLSSTPEQIYIASTGVIGDPVPTEKITGLLPRLAETLSADGGETAANCILTTDTFAKGAVGTARIGETEVTIAGFAKGSGMIAPDMATMLAFLFTDAAIPANALQSLLSETNEKTFNCVTVDSDTSTSDSVLLFATGQADNDLPESYDDVVLHDFKRALKDVMTNLAQQVARDGEGASKFITVTVTGAESDASAKTIALAIANSPLVKTAIAGEDANWGRVIMAVGKSGEKADRDRMSLKIGGVLIAENGGRASSYREEDVTPYMKGREIEIEVDVAVGSGSAFAWTCDLTHGYIDINADYRS